MLESKLEGLNQEGWERLVLEVEPILKDELQGTSGLISALKKEKKSERQQSIQQLFDEFENSGTDQLDDRVDEFTTSIERINMTSQITLQYDLIQTLLNDSDLTLCPALTSVRHVLKRNPTSQSLHHRISAILYKIANQSLSQGNKSNAGQAGEAFARAILSSVGLLPNVHYREQYKSKSGSDTDIVFPFVEDYEDSRLEALVAVQMSTNDRARLTYSELSKGVVGYVVTGNGMTASSKNLSDIGLQIISSYFDNKVRIVCNKTEIKSELERIYSMLKKDPSSDEYAVRKKYFEEFSLSFEDFAKRMSARFKHLDA